MATMIIPWNHSRFHTTEPRLAYKWLRTDRTPPYKRPIPWSSNTNVSAKALRYPIDRWMPTLDPERLELCRYGYHACSHISSLYKYYATGDNGQAYLDLWQVAYVGHYLLHKDQDKFCSNNMRLTKILATHKQIMRFCWGKVGRAPCGRMNEHSVKQLLIYHWQEFAREVLHIRHFN